MKIKSVTIICLLLSCFMIACVGCGTSSTKDYSEIDVDLTALSSTMVYSEVYNMVNTPDDYIGKTVKMEGTAASFYDATIDKTYYACIIQDATACCSQGMEYVLQNEKYYPSDDEEITVVGEFQTYTAEGVTYCTLENAQIL